MPQFNQLNSPKWEKFVVSYADLAVGALTNELDIRTLIGGSQKDVIHSAFMKHSQSFSGGTIATYTLSLGMGGIVDTFIPVTDVKIAPSNSRFALSPMTAPATVSTSRAVTLYALSTIGNLNAATQGSVTIQLLISRMRP